MEERKMKKLFVYDCGPDFAYLGVGAFFVA